MAPHYTLLFLLITLLANPSSAIYPPSTSFLITSCNATSYPTLCLQSFLSNTTQINTEPKRLALAAISSTLAAAKLANATTAHLSKQKSLWQRELTAVQDCARLTADSITSLNAALDEMSHLGGGDKADKEFKRLNMESAMSNVPVVEDTCITSLTEMKARGVVISKIKGVIVPIAQLARNTIDILHRLRF